MNRQQIDSPLVSVILPVHNAQEYLSASLKSILNQSYTNLEIIAIDDFSSDHSYSILEEFARKDSRLIISRNVKRYNMAITLNRALKKVTGQFIAFMRAEDISHKDRFLKQTAFLKINKKVVAVGSQCYLLDRNGKRIGKTTFPVEKLSIYQKPIHGVSVQFEGLMINRLLIPKDLLYFHTNKHPFMYSDIIVKLLQYGEVNNLPIYLHMHRRYTPDRQNKARDLVTTARMWLRSEALFGYRPSLKSFVFPLLRIKMAP